MATWNVTENRSCDLALYLSEHVQNHATPAYFPPSLTIAYDSILDTIAERKEIGNPLHHPEDRTGYGY